MQFGSDLLLFGIRNSRRAFCHYNNIGPPCFLRAVSKISRRQVIIIGIKIAISRKQDGDIRPYLPVLEGIIEDDKFRCQLLFQPGDAPATVGVNSNDKAGKFGKQLKRFVPEIPGIAVAIRKNKTPAPPFVTAAKHCKAVGFAEEPYQQFCHRCFSGTPKAEVADTDGWGNKGAGSENPRIVAEVTGTNHEPVNESDGQG